MRGSFLRLFDGIGDAAWVKCFQMKIHGLLFALLFLAGCASPSAPNTAPTPTAAQKPDKRVILDPALSGILRVVQVRTENSAEGVLQFQVDVQNLTPAAKTVLYQIDWLDRDGASLGIHYDDLRWLLLPHEQAPR